MLIFYLYIVMQVVLESFPVSSSGHLALFERLTRVSCTQSLAIDQQLNGYHAISNVYHLLHGVSAIIIALFFIRSWLPLVRAWPRCWRSLLRSILYVGIADVITGCFFIVLHGYIQQLFPVGLGFGITACALASLYWCRSVTYTPYTWYHACILGIVQGCALLPGISRFGLTYVIGRWLRLSPYKAFEVSFLIEWPLITVASITSLPMLCNPHIYAQFLHPLTLLVILGSGGMAWGGLVFVSYLIRIQRLWLFALYMLLPLIVWVLYASL